jgi:hypothetical protein
MVVMVRMVKGRQHSAHIRCAYQPARKRLIGGCGRTSDMTRGMHKFAVGIAVNNIPWKMGSVD